MRRKRKPFYLLISMCFFLTLHSWAQDPHPTKVQQVQSHDEQAQKADMGPMALNSKFMSFISDSQKALLENALESNPFSAFDEYTLKGLIKTATVDTPLETFLDKNPRHFDFLVKVLRDDDCIQSMVSALKYPNKFEYFGYATLAIFLLTMLLSMKQQSSIIIRLGYRLILFVVMSIAQVGSFVYIFYEHLEPLIDLTYSFYFQ